MFTSRIISKILAIVLSFLCAIPAYCDELSQGITISLIDGSKHCVAFSSNPVITLKSGELIITTDSGVFSLNLQKVETFKYGEVDPAKIETITANSFNGFRIIDNVILLESENHKRSVTVTSVAGVTMISEDIPEGLPGSISMNHLESGVYLVTVDGLTFKYSKR